MNTHKHARLTFARRLEMVQQMTQCGVSATLAASCHGVTPLGLPGTPPIFSGRQK